MSDCDKKSVGQGNGKYSILVFILSNIQNVKPILHTCLVFVFLLPYCMCNFFLNPVTFGSG